MFRQIFQNCRIVFDHYAATGENQVFITLLYVPRPKMGSLDERLKDLPAPAIGLNQ